MNTLTKRCGTRARAEVGALPPGDAAHHQARRRRPHRRRLVVHRHPQRALQPRPAACLRTAFRLPQSRPLHSEQGPLRRGVVRRAGRSRILSRVRARDAVRIQVAFRRPSDAQSARRRAEHRCAGSRPVGMRGPRAGGAEGSAEQPRIHLVRRRRTRGRVGLGGGDVRGAPSPRQPHCHRRPQHLADHRPHARRLQQRAARCEVRGVRLARAQCRRPQSPRSRFRARCRLHPRANRWSSSPTQ